MGNVLRILGIIAISMVMGLVALFLLLFTICGGFQSAGPEEGALVAVCLVVIVGGVAAIVWLGRGLTQAQTGPRLGLAVPPAAASVSPYAGAPAGAIPASQPAAPPARLRGQDFQWLVLLRIALAGYAFMTFGSVVISYVGMMQVSASGYALPMFAGAVVGMAPFVLVLILLRDPPSGLVLDFAAGMAAGSIVFRILWWTFMSLTWRAGDGMAVPMLLGRLALFSAVEVGIVVLALQLRKTIEPGNWGRLVAIAFGFGVWEWISQTMVSLLYRLVY